VSDLVTGIAPYALFAAAAASSLSVAVPYVLGVVGLSSIVKLVAQLSANKTFDMTRYEHRQTVLKATCEYNRVATKVRYLKLAQSGQIEMLTREINQINNIMFYNEQAVGASLDDILKGRQGFYAKIDEIRAQMYKDIRAHGDIKKYLVRTPDEGMICSLGMEIIENHRNGKFPSTISSNFKALLDVGVPHNELSLRATARQYDLAIADLEANVTNASGYRVGYCGQITQRFINTIDRLLQVTEEELAIQEQLYETKLGENPAYKEWHARTSTLEKDRETLKRVVTTMQKASQDSSVMSKSELHQRMENLRNTLFGSDSYWLLSWNKPKAPVPGWLEHTFSMHSRAIGFFKASLSSLMDEVSGMRIEQRKKITYVVDETFSILPETFLRELLLIDIKEENFRFINARRFPVGSPQQEVMCQRLEESWLNWAAALDHLMAMKHFCANISNFIDSKTSSGVIDICGRRQLNSSEDPNSLLVKTEEKLQDRGYKHLALQVSQKMNELKCVGR
jgi:hypothetical protein